VPDCSDDVLEPEVSLLGDVGFDDVIEGDECDVHRDVVHPVAAAGQPFAPEPLEVVVRVPDVVGHHRELDLDHIGTDKLRHLTSFHLGWRVSARTTPSEPPPTHAVHRSRM